MSDDPKEEYQEKLFSVAIDDCRANISRHSRASILELLVALGILFILAFTLLGIAEQQGKVNDIERHGLEKRLSAAKEPLETFREKLSRREFDRHVMLKDSREAAARPERALEIIKAKYKNSFSSTDNLEKLEELEKIDPKAATEAAKKEIATNLAATQQGVDETSEQVKVAGKDYEKVLAEFQQHKSPPVFSDTMLYGAGLLFVAIIGIFTGLYRFHLREITKNEQYKLALRRIRLAANTGSVGSFEGDVRAALIKSAFDVPREESTLLRRGKVESPVPGHPGSDLATLLLNRLLESVEVVFQNKPKGV